MKFTEMEFKYNAEDMKLTDFTAFCVERKPLKQIQASGYDYFYEKSGDADSFCRHRVGPEFNQLTFKRKTKDTNNFVRTEHNINLTMAVTKDQVSSLCGEFGYKYNMALFKNCFIYEYDWYTFVYYVCYNEDMKETGRFFEIEMSEEHNWTSEEEAWTQLVILEKLCKDLGVTPQKRLRTSLFEMFRKNLTQVNK